MLANMMSPTKGVRLAGRETQNQAGIAGRGQTELTRSTRGYHSVLDNSPVISVDHFVAARFCVPGR